MGSVDRIPLVSLRRTVPRLALGGCGVAALWLAASPPSYARRQPYYVLQTAADLEVRPHILFVVDTSGSMGWQAQAAEVQCPWAECETAGATGESRISVARRVMTEVVQNTQSLASFALMTFDQLSAPAATPVDCPSGRFTWSTWYGYFEWAELSAYADFQGAWRLCRGNQQRPWPYLRWDDLGVGASVVADDQVGPLPASPIISTALGEYDDAANATRKVQWFPKFMGVRAHLDATTDPDQSVLAATVGDYGSTSAQRLANVWDQDFYYWPYVDGFPNYADVSMWPFDDALNRAGIAGEQVGVDQAKLYAPFYLDLTGSSVPSDQWGPVDEATALQEVLYKISPLVEGGIDVSGGTPWRSVIGTIPMTPTESNEPDAHTSVASYLKFVMDLDSHDFCAPTSVVLLTDGVPSDGEGGAPLYSRLAELREELGVRTYAVGFFTGGASEINNMACSAAGACDGGFCATPCDDTPSNAWDTCQDPDDPANACAYLANSASELSDVLTEIVQAELDLDLSSGPAYTANDFGSGPTGTADPKQTTIRAYTQFPGWSGHVVRSYCDHRDVDDDLLDICVPASPEFAVDEAEETFGPCPQSREWDAGECLRLTTWSDRRIYSASGAGTPYRISNADGTASASFRAELQSQGLDLDAFGGDRTDAIAAFILGENWPDDWKLPGLSNSAPIVARRVPKTQVRETPAVNIRDPHCAGRRYASTEDVPTSLRNFSDQVWATDTGVLSTPSDHYEYQEAVLIGDDLGILHAFQYDSGNELWGFLPAEALASAVAQYEIGAATRGQPDDIGSHLYGLASTVNQGWIFDDSNADPDLHEWRHIGVFGMGKGGRELFALDLTHMSPSSPDGPFELLWSTETVNQATADTWFGETWARPALTYHVPADSMGSEPDAFLVVGSGYPSSGNQQGRMLATVDPISGALIETAELSLPAATDMIDTIDNYGALVDTAVASQCLSAYWAEAQEAYIVDPAGRLFRWDLGRTAAHEADSGAVWGNGGIATAMFQMPACIGAGSSCTVTAGNPGDPFLFAPAISANNRIDDASSTTRVEVDEYLVALVSGGADDDAIDGRTDGDTFHSSLYLLVDDHQAAADKNAGFSIPSGAPKMTMAQVGSDANYLRMALSDIPRTRRFTPYDGAAEIVETNSFSRATRPIRSPNIRVVGAVASSGGVVTPVDDNEIFYVTYRVYEPPTAACDPRFFEEATQTWHPDRGDTFDITFRLTASTLGGFDLAQGSDDSAVDYGAGFERGLTLVSVEQQDSTTCSGGNCGADSSGKPEIACDNNAEGAAPTDYTNASLPLSTRVLHGFTDVEG